MIQANLPLPVQIVMDDCGWWSGRDGHAENEPFRTGFARDHVPADYAAIASLGRQLAVRPQASMILCEWDRENILRHLPSGTWMGRRWDNRRWVGPWLEEAADIIRRNAAHLEIGLHGIGHEYWFNDGRLERAEWCDAQGTMRPRDQVLAHLDYWARLLAQHGFASFPESYVPTAHYHAFGEPDGLTSILAAHGIKYISTPYGRMRQVQPVQHGRFGFDGGVITIDRNPDPLDWRMSGTPPARPLTGPVCGMHWPNLLHLDPARNEEIVACWVRYLRPYDEQPTTMLARDTRSWCTQLVHHVCTKAKVAGRTIELDFTGFDPLPRRHLNDEITIHIRTDDATETGRPGSQFTVTGAEIQETKTIRGKDRPIFQRLTLRRVDRSASARIEVA